MSWRCLREGFCSEAELLLDGGIGEYDSRIEDVNGMEEVVDRKRSSRAQRELRGGNRTKVFVIYQAPRVCNDVSSRDQLDENRLVVWSEDYRHASLEAPCF